MENSFTLQNVWDEITYQFPSQPTLHYACDYLPILGLALIIYFSKKGYVVTLSCLMEISAGHGVMIKYIIRARY